MTSAVAATVYYLWRERNLRVFQQKASDKEQLIQNIVYLIRVFLCSGKGVKQSQENKDLCVSWGLPMGMKILHECAGFSLRQSTIIQDSSHMYQ